MPAPEVHPGAEPLKLAAAFADPELLERGCAKHDCDGRGVRLQLQDVCDRGLP
jgi:hypothetical protein